MRPFTAGEGEAVARPKRVEGQKGAYERMEDAFWEMLAEMPYRRMTGKEVCARAQVSHNSFYYHFENMNDMAHKMFDRLVLPEIPSAMLRSVGADMPLAGNIASIPDFEQRLNRMRLFARDGSPFLADLLRTSIKNAWFAAMGIDENELTAADQVDLTFIFGGYLALFGSDFDPLNSGAVAAFPQREVGRGAIRGLAVLAQRKP